MFATFSLLFGVIQHFKMVSNYKRIVKIYSILRDNKFSIFIVDPFENLLNCLIKSS